jgi:hypothetical protein
MFAKSTVSSSQMVAMVTSAMYPRVTAHIALYLLQRANKQYVNEFMGKYSY